MGSLMKGSGSALAKVQEILAQGKVVMEMM